MDHVPAECTAAHSACAMVIYPARLMRMRESYARAATTVRSPIMADFPTGDQDGRTFCP